MRRQLIRMIAGVSVRQTVQRGYTLVEAAMVVGLLGVLTAFSLSSFSGTDQMRDAALLQTVQTNLQQLVSQASTRADLSPTAIWTTHNTDLKNALQGLVDANGNGANVQISGDAVTGITVTVASSHRSASYLPDASGNVRVTALSNFTDYHVADGYISQASSGGFAQTTPSP